MNFGYVHQPVCSILHFSSHEEFELNVAYKITIIVVVMISGEIAVDWQRTGEMAYGLK